MILQILPRYDFQFQSEAMTMFLKTLANVDRKGGFFSQLTRGFDFTFIIDADDQGKNGKLSFYLELPDKEEIRITQSLKTMFKDKADVFIANKLPRYEVVNTLSTVEEVNDDKDSSKKRLATYQDDKTFLYILGLLSKRTRITLDFKVLKKFSSATRGFIRNVNTDVQCECLIRVWGKTKYDRNIVRSISESVVNLTAGEKKFKDEYKDTYRISMLSGSEMMNLFQIPSLKNNPDILDRIYYLEIGQGTLEPKEFAQGMAIGKLYHPVQKDREIRIDYTQLRKHMEISGMTGSGKSSFFEQCVDSILMDIVSGKKGVPGFTLFDPMESSALGVLDKVQKLKHDGHDVSKLMDKLHYIDMNDHDYVYPISLLYKGIESTEILDFFKMLFSDGQTVQIDRLLSDGINTLLSDDREYSMKDVLNVFEDTDMREDMLLRMSDNVYNEDCIKFLKAKFNSGQLDPIRNRISPFMNTPHKKLMYGLTSEYDGLKNVMKWFDEGHIVLFNLAGLKDIDVRTIVGYIVMRYYLEARKRPDNSLMHIIFNDECQKTQLAKYNDIIAEGRKPGLMFCPMTQYIERYDEEFLKAILGNIDTKVSFRQGEAGARKIVANTPNCPINAEALKRLPDRVGFVTTYDTGSIKTIMVEVQPPYRYNNGILVPHGNKMEDRVQQEINRSKNRTFARELMPKDSMKRKDAERLVFKGHFELEEKLIIEDERLREGDEMLWEK